MPMPLSIMWCNPGIWQDWWTRVDWNGDHAGLRQEMHSEISFWMRR